MGRYSSFIAYHLSCLCDSRREIKIPFAKLLSGIPTFWRKCYMKEGEEKSETGLEEKKRGRGMRQRGKRQE